MPKKIVVSLCDGMSCGAIALDRLGLMDNDVEYHAFEIDKYAEAVSRMNYPEAIRHGDARNYTKLIGKDVFLLMGGFPCQPYSVAGQGKGDSDKRDLSTLIFDALRELKPKYFLFENVPMKAEDELRITMGITEAYGGQDYVEPIMINSQDFSAHHRKRLYWTNIPIAPYKDKGIVLSDIIEDGMVDRDKSYCVDANYFKGGSMKMYYEKSRRQLVFDTKGCHQVGEADLKGYDIIKRVYSTSGKAPALTTMQGGHREPKIVCGSIIKRKINPDTGKRDDYNPNIKAKARIETRADEKTGTLTTLTKDNVVVNHEDMYWRALTPLECERLQTVPDYYTSYGLFEEGGAFKPISNSQRYKMLGNGWTVDVIQHIMEGMEI
jgi:DNA-cytosine methyltransferase